MRDLTLKQKLFIEGYLETRNGVEAAKRAGYKGSCNVLSVQAFENLRNPKIQVQIEQRLKPFILSANEVLNLLSLHAHGNIDSLLDEDGRLDLDKAKENGSIRLIKRLKFHKDSGAVESLELHDPQSALVHLGKYHKLFTDKVEIVDPREQANQALQAILSETGIAEDKARQIVSERFGIPEQELISTEVM